MISRTSSIESSLAKGLCTVPPTCVSPRRARVACNFAALMSLQIILYDLTTREVTITTMIGGRRNFLL